MARILQNCSCHCLNIQLSLAQEHEEGPATQEERKLLESSFLAGPTTVTPAFHFEAIIVAAVEKKTIEQKNLVSIRSVANDAYTVFHCNYCRLDVCAIARSSRRTLVSGKMKFGDDVVALRDNPHYSPAFGLVMFRSKNRLDTPSPAPSPTPADLGSAVDDVFVRQLERSLAAEKIAMEGRISKYARLQMDKFELFEAQARRDMAEIISVAREVESESSVGVSGRMSWHVFARRGSRGSPSHHHQQFLLSGVKNLSPSASAVGLSGLAGPLPRRSPTGSSGNSPEKHSHADEHFQGLSDGTHVAVGRGELHVGLGTAAARAESPDSPNTTAMARTQSQGIAAQSRDKDREQAQADAERRFTAKVTSSRALVSTKAKRDEKETDKDTESKATRKDSNAQQTDDDDSAVFLMEEEMERPTTKYTRDAPKEANVEADEDEPEPVPAKSAVSLRPLGPKQESKDKRKGVSVLSSSVPMDIPVLSGLGPHAPRIANKAQGAGPSSRAQPQPQAQTQRTDGKDKKTDQKTEGKETQTATTVTESKPPAKLPVPAVASQVQAQKPSIDREKSREADKDKEREDELRGPTAEEEARWQREREAMLALDENDIDDSPTANPEDEVSDDEEMKGTDTERKDREVKREQKKKDKKFAPPHTLVEESFWSFAKVKYVPKADTAQGELPHASPLPLAVAPVAVPSRAPARNQSALTVAIAKSLR